MKQPIEDFLAQHRIHEVECVIPDMTGIARGKILPKDLFLAAGEMRIPKSVLLNTVNGQQPDNGPFVGDTDPDMVFWDNRSLMHLAAGTPDHLRRRMNRTTIEGDAPY